MLNAATVRDALRQVKDPELDMNVIDLGLVYDVEVDGGDVRVKMTLTSPGCPAGPMITSDAYRVIRALEGVTDVDVRHTLERADDPIGVARDHGAGRAAGRRERHLHPHVTPVDLDVVYQAEVDHVHVELGVLHLSQGIPHRRGVQHGRSPSSQPKLVDRVAP